MVLILIGANDFNRAITAATVEANITSITNTLVAGGISPTNIFICNVYWAALHIGIENDERVLFNTWLDTFCPESGYNLVDNDTTHSDNILEQIVAAYDYGDGTHNNSTGSQQLAQNVYDVIPAAITANSQGHIV